MNYAISNEYQDECIQCPTTVEDWRAISSEFNYRWNVPHACGALDGKHVACKRPQIKYFDSNITCNLAAGINLERQHLIQQKKKKKLFFHLLIFMNLTTSIPWYYFPQPMSMQPPLNILIRRQWSRIPALTMVCGTDLNSSTPMNMSHEKTRVYLSWLQNSNGIH